MFKYIKKFFLKNTNFSPIFFSHSEQIFLLVGIFHPLQNPELENSERQNRIEIKETKKKKAQMLSYYQIIIIL